MSVLEMSVLERCRYKRARCLYKGDAYKISVLKRCMKHQIKYIGFVLTRLNSKENMNMVKVFDDISTLRKIKFKCAVCKRGKCS